MNKQSTRLIKQLYFGFCRVVLYACFIVWSITFFAAFTGGTVIVDINHYQEAIPELFLYFLALPGIFIMLWHELEDLSDNARRHL